MVATAKVVAIIDDEEIYNMINYTERLDRAIKKAAWAHEQAVQHRKGTDIPYIIHPFAVMLVASNVTDDEDILIACLMHDVLEDVSSDIYSQQQMQHDFGDRVVTIVKGVTKDESQPDWRSVSNAYLDHLRNHASNESVIVAASDKIHNLLSVLSDHKSIGDELWQRFTTKSATDQLWWYQSVLDVITMRSAPQPLIDRLSEQVRSLSQIVED